MLEWASFLVMWRLVKDRFGGCGSGIPGLVAYVGCFVTTIRYLSLYILPDFGTHSYKYAAGIDLISKLKQSI